MSLSEFASEIYYCPESNQPLTPLGGSLFKCTFCGITIDMSEENEEDYHG